VGTGQLEGGPNGDVILIIALILANRFFDGKFFSKNIEAFRISLDWLAGVSYQKRSIIIKKPGKGMPLRKFLDALRRRG